MEPYERWMFDVDRDYRLDIPVKRQNKAAKNATIESIGQAQRSRYPYPPHASDPGSVREGRNIFTGSEMDRIGATKLNRNGWVGDKAPIFSEIGTNNPPTLPSGGVIQRLAGPVGRLPALGGTAGLYSTAQDMKEAVQDPSYVQWLTTPRGL